MEGPPSDRSPLKRMYELLLADVEAKFQRDLNWASISTICDGRWRISLEPAKEDGVIVRWIRCVDREGGVAVVDEGLQIIELVVTAWDTAALR